MKRNFVNLEPDIRWDQEDVVLLTPAGVKHMAKPESELSAHHVIVEQQYAPGGYYIFKRDNYLGINLYCVTRNTSRVTDFRNAIAEGNVPHLTPFSGYYSSYMSAFQLRIYADRTYVLVRQANLNGHLVTYVNASDESDSVRWNSEEDFTSEHNQTIFNSGLIHTISSEAELLKYKKHLTKKAATSIMQLLPMCYSDLRGRKIQDYTGYWYHVGEFITDTQKLVEEFLDIHSLDKEYLREQYKRNAGVSDCEIKTVKNLIVWCYSRNVAPHVTQTKEEKAESLLTSVQYEWEHPDEYHNIAIWTRNNDDIILILPNSDCSSRWGYGSGYRKLFAYNIKTKKRFYGECSNGGSWTFPVPSLAYILQAMWLGTTSSYNNGVSEEHMVETFIKDDLPIRDLFNGTNIAWILDNVDETYQIFDTEKGRYYGSDERLPINVKDLLDKKRIGNIALSILISTGVPVLEQLLKSRLFNIYFTELEDMCQRSAGDGDDLLWDLDKKRSNNWNMCRSLLTYHGKEKNLKKMFGMNLNMLREIDTLMGIHYGTYRSGYYNNRNEEGYYRNAVVLTGLNDVIGTNIANLDPQTFEKCLNIGTHVLGYYYGSNIWDRFKDLIISNSNMPPKQIIKYIDDYKDCSEELVDYLRMRKQLADIQRVKPDIPDIFSDKRYPMRPTAAKRFIPYLEGMNNRYSWNRTTFLSREDFYEDYSRRYSEAVRRGDFMPVEDENKRLVGILIHMTPAENLKFLHDDASYWISFYEDDAKNALFEEAVKRVAPYEWKDEKLGLQIIAPRCIQDIKEEGHILSHCVASYVDPIINGKENIVFLRRIDMPNHPFYTVEIINENGSKQIRQVHCYRNGNPTDTDQVRAYEDSGYEVYNKIFPIVEFLKRWAKVKKINAQSVHDSYSALCARR